MNCLYLLVGIPGSGKSTYVNKYKNYYSDNGIIVSRDKIRFKELGIEEDKHISSKEYFSKEDIVYHKFISEIRNGIKNNKDVFIDATNLSKYSRRKLITALYIPRSTIRICTIYFDIPLEVCLERNSKRKGLMRVPNESIISMKQKLERPSKDDEDIDETFVVTYNN